MDSLNHSGLITLPENEVFFCATGPFYFHALLFLNFPEVNSLIPLASRLAFAGDESKCIVSTIIEYSSASTRTTAAEPFRVIVTGSRSALADSMSEAS